MIQPNEPPAAPEWEWPGEPESAPTIPPNDEPHIVRGEN